MNSGNNKKYRIKSKARFITFLVIVIGLTIGTFGIFTGLNESVALSKVNYTTVEISDGDTLWNIVEDNYDNNTDIRKAIYVICEYNDICEGELQPGMKIQLPEEI